MAAQTFQRLTTAGAKAQRQDHRAGPEKWCVCMRCLEATGGDEAGKAGWSQAMERPAIPLQFVSRGTAGRMTLQNMSIYLELFDPFGVSPPF